MALTWPEALTWRMERQLLDPVGTGSAVDVVRRLGAIPATPEAGAEAMIAARRAQSRPGDVARALADGRLIKTFAFRGAAYLMAPEQGADLLAVRAAARMWERPGWCDHYRLRPGDWPRLRAAVRDALAGGPLSIEELAAAVVAERRFSHLGPAFADRSATFLKPFAWQGDMSLGPPRDGRATLQRLDDNPRWPGLPEVDDAGVRVVEAYLRAFGPATTEHVRSWIGTALGAGRRRVDAWLATLGERVAEVQIDGEPCWVMSDDRAGLLATAPRAAVRLLPGLDPWVAAAGTDDARIVPPAQRALVTRRAPLVIVGGVVAGTWSLDGDEVAVDWFTEPRSVAPDELRRAARRARARR